MVLDTEQGSINVGIFLQNPSGAWGSSNVKTEREDHKF